FFAAVQKRGLRAPPESHTQGAGRTMPSKVGRSIIALPVTRHMRGNGAARYDPAGVRSRRLFCVCRASTGIADKMITVRGNTIEGSHGMRRRGFIAALLLGAAVAGCGGGGSAPTGGASDMAKIAAEKGIEKSDLK